MFFDRLEARMLKAISAAEDTTSKRIVTLMRNRTPSKHGRYPKYKGPTPSKQSHLSWGRQKDPKGWTVYNNKTYMGKNYPYNLMTGKGWSPKIRAAITKGGGQTERLISSGGKIFSKQMPNGIAPWLYDRKREMKQNIQKAIR